MCTHGTSTDLIIPWVICRSIGFRVEIDLGILLCSFPCVFPCIPPFGKGVFNALLRPSNLPPTSQSRRLLLRCTKCLEGNEVWGYTPLILVLSVLHFPHVALAVDAHGSPLPCDFDPCNIYTRVNGGLPTIFAAAPPLSTHVLEQC